MEKVITKGVKGATTTISFRVDTDIKKRWEKFIKDNNVDRKSTIEQVLLDMMNNH